MAEPTKTFIVAEKRSPATEPPAPLDKMLTSLDGVEVVGINYGRAQIKATPDAAKTLHANFGDWLHVEEVVDRDKPD